MNGNASFAVYFIPEDGIFYEAGSRALGYDIRRRHTVTPHDFIEEHWTSLAKPYGFHLSITDAVYIKPEQLPQVREEVTKLIACFAGKNTYGIAAQELTWWHDGLLVGEQLPNHALQTLHDAFVAHLHPLGSGTDYVEAYVRGELRLSTADAAKLRLFHSPYIFENYRPHFTYIHQHNGINEAARASLLNALQAYVQLPERLQVKQLSLVYRAPNEQYFHVDRVFNL